MSTTNAAQRNPSTPDDPESATRGTAKEAASTVALKAQVAERLAAHRTRRGTTGAESAEPAGRGNAKPRSRIADAVAQRYAQSPTYRAVLAAEAERAIRQAQAEAHIAALNAQAIAAVHQQLLQDLEELEIAFPSEPVAAVEPRLDTSKPPVFEYPLGAEFSAWPEPVSLAERPSSRTAWERSPSELTVHLYEETLSSPRGPRPTGAANLRADRTDLDDDAENRALDAEIAFRQSPVFEEVPEPAMPLPANLLEFPRQLVASRKARPRHAEGPLRDENEEPPEAGQLRIFEVESTPPTAPELVAERATEWASIYLDALDRSAIDPQPSGDAEKPAGVSVPWPYPAPFGRRLAAGSVDAGLVAGGWVVFALIARHWTGASIPAIMAEIAAAAALGFFYVLYQMLFFSLAGATPGMRLAHIALCTFSDENPTRAAMRRRAFTVLLSIVPMGLGILWMAVDKDRLTWHDRISGIYQRSY